MGEQGEDIRKSKFDIKQNFFNAVASMYVITWKSGFSLENINYSRNSNVLTSLCLLILITDFEFDYSKESHRHNLQMEKYARDHEAWSRENIENEQRIRHLQIEKHDANVNFNITNKNLEFPKRNQKVLKEKEPQKSHYIQPSQKMQKYEKVSSGMIGFGLAYGGTKLLDFLL